MKNLRIKENYQLNGTDVAKNFSSCHVASFKERCWFVLVG